MTLGDHVPWMKRPLNEWSIVGMNHYHVAQERLLFVAMTKNDKCIVEEGKDDEYLWDRLWCKAVRADTPSASPSRPPAEAEDKGGAAGYQRLGENELEEDLGFLACSAAAEIASLAHGKNSGTLGHVIRLSKKVNSYIPVFERDEPRSLATTTICIAMAKAFHRSFYVTTPLVKVKVREMHDRLSAIARDPERYGTPERKMELMLALDFCLEFSRHLRSQHASLSDSPAEADGGRGEEVGP